MSFSVNIHRVGDKENLFIAILKNGAETVEVTYPREHVEMVSQMLTVLGQAIRAEDRLNFPPMEVTDTRLVRGKGLEADQA